MLMTKVQAEMEHISIGCNKTTQALSWSRNNLIAYGGCNSVIIYQPESNDSAGKVIGVLNGHKGRVNCVQWVDTGGNDEFLVSGSSDKVVIVWRYTDEELSWMPLEKLSGHTDAVVGLASLHLCLGSFNIKLIVSASADSTMKVWRKADNSNFDCIQTVLLNGGFVHTLAIVKINFCGGNDYILLASSSQDTYVRLWKISSEKPEEENAGVAVEGQFFECNRKELHVVLESLLIGHEGWVYGISWSMQKPGEVPSLLSASMDRTMIIWEYDSENKVWLDKARMGDVGGNTLGYYGCAYSPKGDSVIAHGYQGAFQMWKKEHFETSNGWNSHVTISGHFGEVEDFDWDPHGEFAVTVSADKTTRLISPWRRDCYKTTWHEIARPQVHGYDMKCIAMLNRYSFASSGQEKVARVFVAPQAFYESFSYISKVHEDEKMIATLPLGATVPVLGLSNKAVFEGDIKSWEEKKSNKSQPMKASSFANEDPAPFNPTFLKVPPVEDVLLQNTLWPEAQKLYGHGFDIFCMASSPDGSLLATACKASKPEHANILIWDTKTFVKLDSLSSHTLTVTQLAFSYSGEYLLSVSRDRTWTLYKNDSKKFNIFQKTDKKTSVHTRIIWSCSWFFDDSYFITASRDKKVIVWGKENACWCARKPLLDVGDAATAVSVARKLTESNRYVVAVGLNSGNIMVYTWSNELENCWHHVLTLSETLCPTLTVKRLRWRCQKSNRSKNPKWQLGACSSDHSFRILNFANDLFK